MKRVFFLVTFFSILYCKSYAQEWNKDISPEQKIFNLSRIWKEAAENFAFFDHVKELNWDSLYQAYIPKLLAAKTKYETYRLLERFICSLKDGHTFMYHFNELFPHYRRFTFNNGTLKFLPQHVNGRVFITKVGEEKMTAVMPIGTEIVEVNGETTREYLEKNVFPYIAASTDHVRWNVGVGEMFRGVIDVPKPDEWMVKFRKPDSSYFTLQLTLSDGNDGDWYPAYPPYNPFIDFRKLNDGIAYLSVNGFGRDTVYQIFKTLLPEIKTAKGVVIDLRLNGGGSTNIGADILQHFTDADTLIGSKWRTRIGHSYYKAAGRFVANKKTPLTATEERNLRFYKNNSWVEGGTMKFVNTSVPADRLKMPLIVLTSNSTASAAEDFLIMLDGLKGRAITIGQRTNGSTGQPLFLNFSTGGTFQICTKRDTYPDGREFVGKGIIPDIEIYPDITDILKDRDIVLERAIQEIKKKL